MTDAFNSIEQGLKEALAHAHGATTGIIHEIDIPDPDVQMIRAQTGLSQADFARSIGVKKATLLNWEHRRRNPEGPARVLLALIAADPKIVQRTLAG
ncbi:MAG: helix-turn-helix domain-containing protein [Rhodobacterales bacterium]|nr:helix-turn-helix domain-containing protein [Rhodobacterales bacterium]